MPTQSPSLRLALGGQNQTVPSRGTVRVRNVSARLHHVGDVSIPPGQEADIPIEFKNAIKTAELTIL